VLRKDLIIVIIATFCLTTAFFYIISVRDSVRNLTTDGNTTDNQIYHEPKTVIVCQNITLVPGNSSIPDADIEGYRYVSIFVAYSNPYVNDATLVCSPSCSNITGLTDGMGHSYYTEFKLTSKTRHATLVSTDIAMGAPSIRFSANIVSEAVELTLVVYCYN
jgi:hypothetical protein